MATILDLEKDVVKMDKDKEMSSANEEIGDEDEYETVSKDDSSTES